jgi:hypothetical protein
LSTPGLVVGIAGMRAPDWACADERHETSVAIERREIVKQPTARAVGTMKLLRGMDLELQKRLRERYRRRGGGSS